MSKLSMLLAGSALAACLAVAAAPGVAQAGPCTNDINDVAKALSNDPSLGAPTTGALAGAAPGAIKAGEGDTQATESDSTPPAPSASADGKTGGEGGMKEMNAAAGQVATSAQDVRLQQQGQPTMAQGGKPDAGAERMSMAKNQLDKARQLDQQGNQDCAAAVQEARKMMQGR